MEKVCEHATLICGNAHSQKNGKCGWLIGTMNLRFVGLQSLAQHMDLNLCDRFMFVTFPTNILESLFTLCQAQGWSVEAEEDAQSNISNTVFAPNMQQ